MNLVKTIKEGVSKLLGTPDELPKGEKVPTKKPPGVTDLRKALANTGRLLSEVRKNLRSKVINVTDLSLVAEDADGNWFVAVAVPQKPKEDPETKKKVRQPPLIGLKFLPLASSSPALNFSDRDTETIPKLEASMPDFHNFRFVTTRELSEKVEWYLEQIMASTKEVLASLEAVEAMKKGDK